MVEVLKLTGRRSRDDRVWIKRSYENCSGCRRCEIACALHHEGRIWPEASRIRVFMLIPGVEIPHLCFQCEDYPCVDVCPTTALSVSRDTGAVTVDSSKCTACALCVQACPGGVPHIHPAGGSIVICDLCDGQPECVAACLEGGWNTLVVVSQGQIASRKIFAKPPRELTREVAGEVLGEEIVREVLD